MKRVWSSTPEVKGGRLKDPFVDVVLARLDSQVNQSIMFHQVVI